MGNAKKSAMQIGLFDIPVRLEVAVDDDSSGTKTVCTNGGTHEVTRVKMHVDCPACETSHSSVFGYPERGIERDGKLVLLTDEEIKAAAGEPIKKMALEFRSRAQVDAVTVVAGSVQNVLPEKGAEKGYKALCDILSARPHMVAVTVWAPSTKNALWRLDVVQGRIVATKLPWPEDVRALVPLAPAEVTDVEATMMGNLVDAMYVDDFDVTEFRDIAREGVEALIASKSGTAVPIAPTAGQAAPVGDMMAALQAELDRIQPKKKPSARGTAAKKTVAKKAPVKKAAAKRPAKRTSAA